MAKCWGFAQVCDRNFEVGRQSRVGVLEVTTNIVLFFDICKSWANYLYFFIFLPQKYIQKQYIYYVYILYTFNLQKLVRDKCEISASLVRGKCETFRLVTYSNKMP